MPRKLFSLFVCIVLAVSLMPSPAYATDHKRGGIPDDLTNNEIETISNGNFEDGEFFLVTDKNKIRECAEVAQTVGDLNNSGIEIDKIEKFDQGSYVLDLHANSEEDIYELTTNSVNNNEVLITPVKKLSINKKDHYSSTGDTNYIMDDRFSSSGSSIAGDYIRNIASKSNQTQYVAVLDGGFNLTHKELKGKFETSLAYIADKGECGSYKDIEDHGTAVSSCIAGIKNNGIGGYGVCPDNVKIIPISVSTDGKSDSITEYNIIKGLKYIEKILKDGKVKNLHIVNISLGSFYSNSEISKYGLCTKNDPLFNEINKLRDLGVVCVCSGGNGGCDFGGNGKQLPADYSNCISVTSSHDGSYCDFSEVNKCKDITAPGYNIPVASAKSNTSCALMSGTSFSSPIIAGELANLLLIKPGASINKAISILKNSCIKLSKQASNYRSSNGSKGVPNMAVAVDNLLNRKSYSVGVTDCCYNNGLRYGLRIKSTNTVELTMIDRTSKNIGTLKIPKKVKLHDGNVYNVTQIAKKPKIYLYGGLKNITIDSNIENINKYGIDILSNTPNKRSLNRLTLKSKHLDKNDFKNYGLGQVASINKVVIEVSADHLVNLKYKKKYESFLNRKYLRCNVNKIVVS